MVAARLLHENKEGILVRFEVRDSGIGMTPEEQSRLFIPFEQADSSTTRRYGGTGLGLAISHRLAEAMNGAIGAHSELHQGSTFWFTARLENVASGTLPATLNSRRGHAERQTALQQLGAHILLAEDNLVNQEVALDLLRSAGLSVDIAQNGLEAVDLCKGQAYDLILMDMQMPVLDGLEATRQIRTLPAGARIPILAMTANAFAEDRELCLAAGMNDHIAKPVDPDVLFAALLRWLPTSSRQPKMNNSSVPPVSAETIAALPTQNNGEAELQLALSMIPGLDLEFGLSAVRGRMNSYKRLLGKFSETHANDFALIRQRLAEGQIEEARRLAHSLKGAAGSLGAVAIQKAASALEIGIRDQYEGAALAHLIDQTAEIYSALQNQLAKYLVTETVIQPNPVNAEQLLPLLRQLQTLLSECDMNVQSLVRNQQGMLLALLGERLTVFNNLVADFDFEGAVKLLEESYAHFPALAALLKQP
jgi:two-component system sensor histidine kinase/response regulator